jgi:hypothetical protein
MKRARWTVAISALLLALAVIPWLARAGKAGAAKAEGPAPSPVVDTWADGTPAGKAEPDAGQPRPAGEDRRPDGATTPPAAPDPAALKVIGSLAAAHYFQTYLNIGFLADGKDKGTYADKDARQVLLSVLSVLDSVDRQLETFSKASLAKDDRDSLEQMRAIAALLRQQGKELQTYWDSGRAEDADRYDTLRRHSYTAMRKLMGIGG